MMDHDEQTPENVAQTLARVLPDAKIISRQTLADIRAGDGITHIAVPTGFKLEKVDHADLLPHPRRTIAAAKLTDIDSFLAYVKRHAQPHSVVWCDFNPQSYALSFQCVIDEHAPDTAGWRKHSARFEPEMSAEWKVWSVNNSKPKAQIEFAEFIERHEPDIAAKEGYPTSLQMLQMATEFEANSDKRIKSVVRLQGGGVRMDYVDDDDTDTLAQMKVFEKFQIGIPVFWANPGYLIEARLKYRHGSGKVTFWYELIRADRVHEAAAKDLITAVRNGIGDVPLLMGACS